MNPAPQGLTRRQLEFLGVLASRAAGKDILDLSNRAKEHAAEAARISANNSFVNKELALAIATTIQAVGGKWGDILEPGKYWLAGAIEYFLSSEDEEKDFQSPIGFEDDVEIINACLRLASLDSLCINVEDF